MNSHPLLLVSALAVTSMAGLIGMLVTEGHGDVLFLALASLPVALGGWRAWRLRRAGRRQASNGN